MAVEVLSPPNVLKDSFNRQPLASRPMNFNRNPNSNRVVRTQAEKKNRRSNRPNNNSPPPVQKTLAANKLVMGQVKILKRGEEIPKAAPNPPSPPPKQTPQVPDLGSTTRLGPEPKLIQKLVPKQTLTAVLKPVKETKTDEPIPVQSPIKAAEPKPVQQQTKTAEPNPVQSPIKAAEPKPVQSPIKPAESKPVQKRTKIVKVKLVPKKTKLAEPMPSAGFYAGSASSVISPEPSSLPLPSFFAKKSAAVSATGDATSGLLKLLRLNLP